MFTILYKGPYTKKKSKYAKYWRDLAKEYEIEGRYNWRGLPSALPYDYACFADGTPFE